jgi:HD-GYP domain-containing protein (c-di-GMP phosphodiesterase class II)
MAVDENGHDQHSIPEEDHVPGYHPAGEIHSDGGGTDTPSARIHADGEEAVTEGSARATQGPSPLGEAAEVIEEAADAQGVQSAVYSARQIARARGLLTALYAVRRTSRFYPMDHPATIDGAQELQDRILEYHDEGVDIEFAFFDGELLFGQKLLPEESVLFDQLIRELTSVGVGALSINRGIQLSETLKMVSVLAADAMEVERAGGVPRMAAEAGLTHAVIGDVRAFDRDGDGEGGEEPHEAYGGAIELMREIDMLVRRNRVVSSNHVKSVVKSLVDNVVANRYAMLQLTGLKNHDEYTFFHSANVALLSLALGSMITSDYRFLSSLGTGALLHDIGKMTLNVDILNKPGALSPDEWAQVRQHPIIGAEQAALIPGLDHSSIVIIFEHHLRFDGSGYPSMRSVNKQHLASRIVAVADAYDAMTSRRSYSAARMQDEAMALLAGSAASAVDPDLLRLFVSMMGIYPPRTVVRLSDQSIGIVLQPSEGDPLRPLVRVIAEPGGRMVEPVDLDLSQTEDLGVDRSIDGRTLNVDVEDYV